MNRKGFTLVELMGVLVILGVLLIVTVPTITKTLNNTKENEIKEYEKTVCLAVKSYVEVKRFSYPKEVKFSVLRSEGYLSTRLKNPETGKLDSGDRKVRIELSNGTLVCSFIG